MIQWSLLPLLWQWALDEVRMEAQRELAEGPAEIMRLSLDEWEQVRLDEREILLDGKMYDVKKAAFSGDSVVLVVKRDRKEESVLDAGKALIHQSPDSNSHPTALTTDIFYTVYILPDHFLPAYIPRDFSNVLLADVGLLPAGRQPDCPELPPGRKSSEILIADF